MTIGVSVVTCLAGRVSVAPLVTMISTSRRTNSAARSGRRLFLPSAYRYSMTIFCPSIHPRSRSPCWNALCQGAVSEAENGERMPIRAIFFGCWASAFTTRATNTTATRIDDSAAFFITHLVSSVIYHAHGNKGMCDLHGGRRHGFVERKDPILLERQLDGTQDLFDGEYSSILASPCGYLITLFARASTSGGIVRPICLAALRLMTSSILSTPSTGKSLGLTPVRMRWTYFADTRPISWKLTA